MAPDENNLGNTFSTHPPLIEKYTYTHTDTRPPARKIKQKGSKTWLGCEAGLLPQPSKVQLVYTTASLSSRRDSNRRTRHVDKCKRSVVPGFGVLSPISSPTGKTISPAGLPKMSLSSPAQQMGFRWCLLLPNITQRKYLMDPCALLKYFRKNLELWRGLCTGWCWKEREYERGGTNIFRQSPNTVYTGE